MNSIHRARTVGVLVGIGLVMGWVHVFLIPPFQNPDEVQHYLLCASHAYGKEEMAGIESRVLEHLKNYKWFHFVGIGPGWETTQKISDVSFVFHFDAARQSNRHTLFHIIYGKLLGWSGIRDELTGFYFLRLLSTCVYVGLIFLCFLFFQQYFPESWQYLMAGLLLIFQFTTIMNAVNYDVFMIGVGSLFFIVAYGYMVNGKKMLLFYLLVLAALAALTKLVGFMFLVYILVLLVIKSLDKLKRVTWNYTWMKQAGLILLMVLIGFSWMNYLFPGRFFNFYSLISRAWNDFAGSFAGEGVRALNASFFNSMVDSFYFHTGWMGFKIGSTWYLLIKLFLGISLVGLTMALVAKGKKNEDSADPGIPIKNIKKWLVFSLVVLVLQCLAIWFYYGDQATAQGRYLFPLIIPVIILFFVGLQTVEKQLRLKRNDLILAYILFQVVLTVVILSRVISVFYLEIASPHAGL